MTFRNHITRLITFLALQPVSTSQQVFMVQNHCPGYSFAIAAKIQISIVYGTAKKLLRRVYVLFPAHTTLFRF